MNSTKPRFGWKRSNAGSASGFGLIYRVRDDVVEIVAVAHDRQKPEYWRNRI